MKKRKLSITIALMLALISIISCLSGCTLPQKTESLNPSIVDGNGNALDQKGKIYKMPDTIIFKNATLMNEDNSNTRIYITADIKPIDAYIDDLEWSIRWKDDAPLKNENINDFIKIDKTDEKRSVMVECLKAFKDSKIILKAFSNASNKGAESVLKFEGMPTTCTIEIDKKVQLVNDIYYLVAPNLGSEPIEYVFTIKLNNSYDYVDQRFYKLQENYKYGDETKHELSMEFNTSSRYRSRNKGINRITGLDMFSSEGKFRALGELNDYVFDSSYDEATHQFKIKVKASPENYYLFKSDENPDYIEYVEAFIEYIPSLSGNGINDDAGRYYFDLRVCNTVYIENLSFYCKIVKSIDEIKINQEIIF